MTPTQWLEGTVVENKAWTSSLYSLYVKVDFPIFEAGQFGRLALSIDGEQISRPYSFANVPGESLLEFYYIHVPMGPLTTHLITLKPGDTILVHHRAAGVFTLQEVPNADTLWMLATGTALGAFLSMLGTPLAWQKFKKVVLVHAVRYQAELTHQDRIQALLSSRIDQLSYVPFVSREPSSIALSGRIPEAILEGRLEQKTGLSLTPETSQVMLCGNPHMVKDTTEILLARQFKKNLRKDPGHITVENYWKD